ncbi:MAG: alpha/beta hydrolase [Chloroflexi bacterium]|nr:alpha/beta hydrolase [Chloroflexota bacterium]
MPGRSRSARPDRSSIELREADFAAPEVHLHYAEGPANGPAFVLLHGGAARWQYGRHLLELLAPAWHVFAPDLRGHGGSGRVAGAYALVDYVRDLAAFLEHLVRQPAVVFGHSLGGEVAVMLAAQQPALVRALIVADAPLSTSAHVTEEPAHRAQNERWHELAGRSADEIEAALRATDQHDAAFLAFQALALHQLDADVLAAVLAGPATMLAGYEPRVLLPAVTCPVLLLQADPLRGAVLRDDQVALGLNLLPHARHVRLTGIGHALHAPPEQTRTVVSAIHPFLREIRETR